MASPESPLPKRTLWKWLLLASIVTIVLAGFVWWRVRSEFHQFIEPIFTDEHGRVVKPSENPSDSNELRRIGEMWSLTRKSGVELFGRGSSYKFEARYPVFNAATRFHQAVSDLLLAELRVSATEVPDMAWSNWWKPFKEDWRDILEVSTTYEVLFVSNQALSLCETIYEYSGGAHGNGFSVGRNFIEQDGGLHEIQLNELFDREGWQTLVSHLCIADLRRQGAAWVQPAADEGFRVMAFDAASLSFTLSPSGINFYFAPYVASPYSDGEFEVLLPYEQLKNHLRPAGPHRLFQQAATAKTP